MKLICLVFSLLWSFALIAKAPLLSARELQNPPAKVIRTCCSFGSDVSIARIPFVKKTDIISINELGEHKYMGGSTEGNGIIYTRTGGFIDIGHMRDYADWTAYLYNVIKSGVESGQEIILKIGAEGGTKTLIIPTPDGNVNLFELAGSIAYDLSVWHEIATWYGISYIPMVNEKYSSFSPEDLYSNLLGVKTWYKSTAKRFGI